MGMKPITRLILGDWAPNKSEFLKFSVTSKACLAAALAMLFYQSGYLNIISMDTIYLLIILTFITIKLSGVLADPIDPFQQIEAILTFVSLGGLWDQMEETNEEKQE